MPAWIKNFENLSVRGRLFKKRKIFAKKFQRLPISRRHNSAMIIDRRKFTTKLSLYGMSSFHFCRWNQFILLARWLWLAKQWWR